MRFNFAKWQRHAKDVWEYMLNAKQKNPMRPKACASMWLVWVVCAAVFLIHVVFEVVIEVDKCSLLAPPTTFNCVKTVYEYHEAGTRRFCSGEADGAASNSLVASDCQTHRDKTRYPIAFYYATAIVRHVQGDLHTGLLFVLAFLAVSAFIVFSRYGVADIARAIRENQETFQRDQTSIRALAYNTGLGGGSDGVSYTFGDLPMDKPDEIYWPKKHPQQQPVLRLPQQTDTTTLYLSA